jgi:Cu/Ag efflux protein CusF
MAPMLRNTLGLVAAGFLMLAPISMAAGTPGAGTAGGGAGSTTSPGAGTTQPGIQTQQPGHGTMGQQAGHRFHATVENIDPDDRTVQLRPEGSAETIKLKVPEREILSGLKKGDRVQLSLQKATGAMDSPSGAGGMRSPGTGGTGSSPGAGGAGSSPGTSGMGSSGTSR